MAAAVTTADTDAAGKSHAHVAQAPPAQPMDESMEAMSAAPDTETQIVPADEVTTEQTVPKPVGMATHQQVAQATQPFDEQPTPVVHSRQMTPQEPPPFFEAAAIQSATSVKSMAVKQESKVLPEASAKKPASTPVQAAPQRT